MTDDAYYSLYDAVALHDVKDLAIQQHIKAADLLPWYNKLFGTKLSPEIGLSLLKAHNATDSIFYEWFFKGLKT